MARGWGSSKPRKSKHRRRNAAKAYAFLLLTLICALLVQAIVALDTKMLPAVLAATDMSTKTKVNIAINNSIEKAVQDLNLTSDDFYYKNEDDQGKINSLSVNTVLINQICGQVAVDVSSQLNQLDSEKITIPIGTLFGIEAFANAGPRYAISVLPIGNALVDYSSSFESVGINQINFQIWLTVDSTIQIINPIQNTEVTITRKISLVNTVINGEVPPTYLGISNNSEKLIN